MKLSEKLTELLPKLSDIEAKYTERRGELDKQRFLANWRWSTENPERKNDCNFIGAVVGWVGEQSNRLEYLEKYEDVDPKLKQSIAAVNESSLSEKEKQKEVKKLHDSAVLPYLGQAMLGAMVLTLSKITKSYTSARLTGCDEATVKSYSALAYVLLNGFNLKQLSDIDPLARLSYLQSLVRFIQVMDAGHQKNKSLASYQWHLSYSNEALLQQLSAAIASVEFEIASIPAVTQDVSSLSAM